MTATKVLLVEDAPTDVDLMTKALGRSRGEFELESVKRLSDALEALQGGETDVILLDLGLPDSNGIETVRRVHDRHVEIPVIVTTALDDDSVVSSALEHGAQDFLIKDHLEPDTLERSIRYSIQRHRHMKENERLVHQLRRATSTLKRKNRRLAKLYKTAHKFVNHVSHEFRTPLTVIKEYVAMLREGLIGEINDEQCRMLDIVNDRADDLNHMVEDLLDVSKMQSGLMCVHRQVCRVEGILTHVRTELEKKAALKSVDIRFDVDDPLPDVYCDSEKVGRVIINFTMNAIKFCGDPGEVCVSAGRSADSSEVIISVADNGPGIARKNLQKIFKQFKQIGFNPRGGTDGFGLGLGIAKELVELNFGEVRVESEPGRGSEFSFTVPVNDIREVTRRYLDRLSRKQDTPGLPTKVARSNGPASVSLVLAQTNTAIDAEEAEDMESYFHYALRPRELLFRADDRSWLLVLPIDEFDLSKFFDRMKRMKNEADRNRLHGPLPHLDLKVKGTFHASHDREAILAAVAETNASVEAALG